MSETINVPMAAQRDIKTVTTEIRTLHRQAQCMVLGYAIEIGRRLKEAKAMLDHGQWGPWLREEVDFSQSSANNFMRIFEEYGAQQVSLFGDANSQALGNLPYTHALRLLALPAEERESFAEEHHAEELSTRELEKLIRERDEARRAEQDAQEKAAAADKARAAAEELAKGAEDARRDALAAAERLKNAQAAEKDAKAAAKQAKAELKALRENPVIPAEVLEKLRAEETQRAAETAQQETARRVAEAEKAAQESARRAEQAERQLAAADPEVATFKAWFRAVQDDFTRMQETHAQVTDQAKADKLRAAVRALLERERTVWG